MSFNVEGLSAAKEQLIVVLRQRLQCAVVCIQGTHRGPDAIRPSIPGMDVAIERPHSQYGGAIFVTSGTIVNTTSLTDNNNIEILRVDPNGISVTSVYKPPGERFSFHQPLSAVGDQHQVIVGDFNSHLLLNEPTACEPFKDTVVCFPPKEPRSQTRTECSVERYQLH